MKSIADLHEAIAAAGIPIDGVSKTGQLVDVQFKPEATAEQRTQAAAIVAAWDWTPPRPPRARSVIRQAIAGLTTTQQNQLRNELVIEQLLDMAEHDADRLQAIVNRLGLNVTIREAP